MKKIFNIIFTLLVLISPQMIMAQDGGDAPGDAPGDSGDSGDGPGPSGDGDTGSPGGEPTASDDGTTDGIAAVIAGNDAAIAAAAPAIAASLANFSEVVEANAEALHALAVAVTIADFINLNFDSNVAVEGELMALTENLSDAMPALTAAMADIVAALSQLSPTQAAMVGNMAMDALLATDDPAFNSSLSDILGDATLGDIVSGDRVLSAYQAEVNNTISRANTILQRIRLIRSGVTVPLAPMNVVATRGNKQVTLTFTAPNNGGSAIIDYTIEAYAKGATKATFTKTAVTTTGGIVFGGLTNGTSYTFKVKARNLIGFGPPSASAAVTPATIPSAPTINVVTTGNTKTTVAFSAPSSNGGSAVTGYELQTFVNGSTTAFKVNSVTSSPFLVTGLVNGTAYTYKIRAKNAVGWGALSAASVAVVPVLNPPLSEPTNVVATRGNTQVTLTFKAPINNGGSAITSYNIEAFQSGATTATFVKTGVKATTGVVFSSLVNGTSYTFKVKARNSTVFGPLSLSSKAVTPATIPGVPVITTLTPGAEQITVAFTAPTSNGGASINNYEVRAFVSGTTTLHKVAIKSSSPIAVTGLTHGTNYVFQVRAKNAVGYSSFTAKSTAATPLANDINLAAGKLSLTGGQNKLAGNVKLSYQTDGNFVVYNAQNVAIWSTQTAGRACTTGCKASFQADGNLVLYQNSAPYWASNSILPGAKLFVTHTSPYIKILDAQNKTVWTGIDYTLTQFQAGLNAFVLYSASIRTFKGFKLIMQNNGAFAIYSLNNHLIWMTPSPAQNCSPGVCKAVFQSDGNFVLYNGSTHYYATSTNTGATSLSFSPYDTYMMTIRKISGEAIWSAYDWWTTYVAEAN